LNAQNKNLLRRFIIIIIIIIITTLSRKCSRSQKRKRKRDENLKTFLEESVLFNNSLLEFLKNDSFPATDVYLIRELCEKNISLTGTNDDQLDDLGSKKFSLIGFLESLNDFHKESNKYMQKMFDMNDLSKSMVDELTKSKLLYSKNSDFSTKEEYNGM